MESKDLIALLRDVLPKAGRWRKPLHLLQGLGLVEAGQDVPTAARTVGTTARALQEVLQAPDPLEKVLGGSYAPDDKAIRRSRLQLGQLVLGRAAEVVFEDVHMSALEDLGFELKDYRDARNTTDFRLYDSHERPLYRFNIKFFGTQFRRAVEMVGLDPSNCFALATYKIARGLKAQHDERLPYIFVIVGVPNLTAESVGTALPPELIELVASVMVSPRGPTRDVEDAVVAAVADRKLPAFTDTVEQIRGAEWYVLSARRADALLRSKLFERVFALRIPNFTRQFRGAELDMHFSLKEDLVPLDTFTTELKTEGLTKVATMLERGEI